MGDLIPISKAKNRPDDLIFCECCGSFWLKDNNPYTYWCGACLTHNEPQNKWKGTT